jgi:hypothetical protein
VLLDVARKRRVRSRLDVVLLVRIESRNVSHIVVNLVKRQVGKTLADLGGDTQGFPVHVTTIRAGLGRRLKKRWRIDSHRLRG